jgi:hypothetical protein
MGKLASQFLGQRVTCLPQGILRVFRAILVYNQLFLILLNYLLDFRLLLGLIEGLLGGLVLGVGRALWGWGYEKGQLLQGPRKMGLDVGVFQAVGLHCVETF